MRVHCLQHVPFEGIGCIGRWLEARSAEISVSKLFEAAHLPRAGEIDWLIVMGGPMSVNDEASHPWLVPEKRFIAEVVAARRRVLGICLGAQLIASSLGAGVSANPEREIGWFPIEPTPAAAHSPFRAIFSGPLDVFHWHGETFDLPDGATPLATSAACAHQAFCIGERVLGLQFHLETTPESAQALIEHCPGDLAPGRFVQAGSEMLRDEERFRRAHGVLYALLDRLEALGA
jgi:GMP synthase-like glutamine amidotransferase